MKLLSPQQTKDTKAQELTRELLRTEEMHKLAEQARKMLANAEGDFSNMLAGQRARWAQEEKEHEERRGEMNQEVLVLSEQLRILNIPIEIERNRAHDLLEEAQIVLRQAKEKDKKLEATQELLEDRLDDVADEDRRIKADDDRLSKMIQGIDEQKELTKKGAEKLSLEMQDFYIKKFEVEQLNAKLQDREVMANQREAIVLSQEEEIKRKKAELINFEARLNDYKIVLDERWAKADRLKIR